MSDSEYTANSGKYKLNHADRAWHVALERAVTLFGDEPDVVSFTDDEAREFPAFVRRHTHTRDVVRVDWLEDGGMTCSCSLPRPCPHMARAWAEYMNEWHWICRLTRRFGLEGMARAVAWHYGGVLLLEPIRPLRSVQLRREFGTALADVPNVSPFSPTGVEWGYRGSGPRALAYSILAYFYGPIVAEKYSFDFMTAIIARIPRNVAEYKISIDDILHFMKDVLARGKGERRV